MKSKISSSGSLVSKVGFTLLSLFLLRTIYNQFDFTFMAFVAFIVCFAVFFYISIILFYDPQVIYDENYIYFKKFYQVGEVVSLKQIVGLSQNAKAFSSYGSPPGSKYSYRLDYINNDGKSKSVSFYSEESQELEIRELIAGIRKINPYFIIDWTVPKKIRE